MKQKPLGVYFWWFLWASHSIQYFGWNRHESEDQDGVGSLPELSESLKKHGENVGKICPEIPESNQNHMVIFRNLHILIFGQQM